LPRSDKIEVADEGPGIPEEYQVKLFEKFTTLDHPAQGRQVSTGLGLVFCKLAVEAHGGRIEVISASGRGTTFRISLPAEPIGPKNNQNNGVYDRRLSG
jgi:signal transduction histidine kinase